MCAPSNIAVDNLLRKLSASNSVVRLGHPARVNVNLQQFTLGRFMIYYSILLTKVFDRKFLVFRQQCLM